MPSVAVVAGYLEQLAPRRLAAGWDNVGLLLGDPAVEVRRILTCLTVTPESTAEAITHGAQLIVSHHPILFRPIQQLTSTTPEGEMLLSLARTGVAVYSPHTAFDNTAGGINDLLAQRLGLREVVPLRRGDGTQQCKIVVFVPESDLARVSDALFAAGAGNIGQYSQCSFRLGGTGTFYGSDAANPTVGQKGCREEVSEWRLEAVCPESGVDQAIAAMRKAHSYEEPAYDIYPLRSAPSPRGEGRLGKLATAAPLAELAGKVKAMLRAQLVQIVGDPRRPIERVAIACGAGAEFLGDAARAGADALLTGEARFHDYLAAQSREVALILPGHYASERLGAEELAVKLAQEWPALEVWASKREQDPVHHL